MVGFLTRRGDLFDEFDVMRREMNSLLASAFGPASIRAAAQGSFPALNVGTGPESVDVYLLAPGIDPKKLDISLEGRVLTVSGEREANAQPGRAYLKERFSGPFRRAITLTEDVDPERVEARYQDGVVHIRLPRRSEARARRIEVK
jgi:HSP20 family protein